MTHEKNANVMLFFKLLVFQAAPVRRAENVVSSLQARKTTFETLTVGEDLKFSAFLQANIFAKS